MFKQSLCKHSMIVQTRAERKRYPLVGLSIPWASLCLIAGLGCGGFGSVYLGEECQTDPNSEVRLGGAPRLIAVKIVNTRWCSARFVDSLRSEHKIYSKIHPHPNIVRVFYFYETMDRAITLLEYAEGGDVNDLLNGYGRIIARYNDMIRIIYLQVLDAVAHIHNQGISHCDIKPENFLCKREGGMMRVVLTDFGLSTDEPIIYGYGRPYNGTRHYLPPECLPPAPSSSVFPQAMDIWALGVFLYQLCSGGSCPWQAASKTSDWDYSLYTKDPIAFFLRFPLSLDTQDFLLATWESNPWNRQELSVSVLRKHIKSTYVFTAYSDAETVLNSVSVPENSLLDVAAWQRGRCPRSARKRKQQKNYDKLLDIDSETQEAALLALALSAQLEFGAS